LWSRFTNLRGRLSGSTRLSGEALLEPRKKNRRQDRRRYRENGKHSRKGPISRACAERLNRKIKILAMLRSAIWLSYFLSIGTASGQAITATLLGTAGPSLSTTQAEAGLLIPAGPETLLFDCGHLVPERLYQLGIYNLTKVFLTHLHSDHTEGLPILWMNEVTWESRGANPLQVFGPGEDDPNQPAGTADMTTDVANAYATNTHIRRDLVEHLPAGGIEFQTTEISQGVVYTNNGVTVTAFLVDHDPVQPAFGYRVDYAGHSVVFSGDTTYSANLVQYAQGADVLIHEVILSPPGATTATDAIVGYHSTPEQAASVFMQVAPRLAVYTHIVDQTGGGALGLIARTQAAGYTGPLQVRTDLTSIAIGNTITVKSCASTATPTITAVTNVRYEPTVTSGDTVIVWGNDFSVGGDSLIWSPVSGQNVSLSDNGPAYFWDLSTGQINATLSSAITAGQWYVYVQTACGILSSSVAVTVSEEGARDTGVQISPGVAL
jgi:ribonuclease Z